MPATATPFRVPPISPFYRLFLMDELTRKAEEFRGQAGEVLRIMRAGARRAFVLEITGTPKAGKTSTLTLLHSFFKSSGFKVYTLRERAADCPLPMKGHFDFNAWTTCTMLSEVLENYDSEVDLVILDRGFFDALIWLSLQLRRGQLTAQEEEIFRNFVLLERWRKLVDLTVVMTADPAKAMEREQHGSLLERKGSLMNPDSLRAFNDATNQAMKDNDKYFTFLSIDTTQTNDAKENALNLLEKVLPKIKEWAEQTIWVVPRAAVEQVFSQDTFLYAEEAAAPLAQLASQAQLKLRHEIERNDEWVQIVGCGIAVHQDRLFLLERAAKDEKNSYGKTTLWKGCHIEQSTPLTIEAVAERVESRLLEELHLRTKLELSFVGMAWNNKNAPESRHMGLMFRANISDPLVADSMDDKEFRKGPRGHAMTGTFRSQKDIVSSAIELALEPWSSFVVSNVGFGGT